MGVGIWPNGIICEAGDTQVVALDGSSTPSAATVVVGETYRVFAPMLGVCIVGFADPDTTTNIRGVIPPGGFLDIRATGTSLYVGVEDVQATYGPGGMANGTAYVVKLTDNA